MATIRVPVTIEYPQEGGPGKNVWNVRTVGPSEEDDVDQVGDALDALVAFYTDILTYYPQTTVITLGTGMIRDPLGTPTYFPDDVRTLTGVTGGDYLSPLLAVSVGWRTSVATRSGRGRTFVGPFNGAVNDGDGTVDGGFLTVLRAAAVDLVDASMASAGWSIGVLSVKQGLIRDITGSAVQDRFAYLSSRRD